MKEGREGRKLVEWMDGCLKRWEAGYKEEKKEERRSRLSIPKAYL